MIFSRKQSLPCREGVPKVNSSEIQIEALRLQGGVYRTHFAQISEGRLKKETTLVISGQIQKRTPSFHPLV